MTPEGRVILLTAAGLYWWLILCLLVLSMPGTAAALLPSLESEWDREPTEPRARPGAVLDGGGTDEDRSPADPDGDVSGGAGGQVDDGPAPAGASKPR